VLSGRQNYLARVLALFYIGLCLADLREREALVHMGADPAIRDALQQFVALYLNRRLWPLLHLIRGLEAYPLA
jgi:hypothetical protein